VSLLNSLEKLIDAIKNNNDVKRFKELEAIIDQDQDLNKEYKDLLNLQKLMVNDEAKQSSRLPQSKANYEAKLQELMSHILMEEYLDLLEVVNNDLQMIQSIITNEINMDIE
jgi:cell fate (sporulation/competence/biofilm development) regulator YmcA (YheA/YmcA/DUF963 family)